MRRSRGKDFGALLPRQTEAPKSPSFSGERQRRENRVQSRLGIWGSDMSPPPMDSGAEPWPETYFGVYRY